MSSVDDDPEFQKLLEILEKLKALEESELSNIPTSYRIDFGDFIVDDYYSDRPYLAFDSMDEFLDKYIDLTRRAAERMAARYKSEQEQKEREAKKKKAASDKRREITRLIKTDCTQLDVKTFLGYMKKSRMKDDKKFSLLRTYYGEKAGFIDLTSDDLDFGQVLTALLALMPER